MPRFYSLILLLGAALYMSPVYAADAPSLHVTAAPITLPLVADETIPLTFTLSGANNRPLAPADLGITHTERIHILAIDPTLTDYHHLHPEPGKQPGTYKVTFTPTTNGPYRFFIQTSDAKTNQSMETSVDVGGPFAVDTAHLPDRTSQVVIDGYKFLLLLPDAGLKAGEETMINVQVTRNDQGVKTLEPIMGAFAHLVGFTQDGAHTVHMHPMGDEPTRPTDRGGPELIFHLTPSEAGLLPLFAQVNIGGKIYTVPFVTTVATNKE